MEPKPKAVITADVHYSVHTLKLADVAMKMAVQKANDLGVPLIVAGDLHDTKANLRGECVNAMLKTFSQCRICYILRGNHDQINEKSKEHSINFLAKDNIFIIDEPGYAKELGLYLIPYHHDADELRTYLKTIPKESTLIMHQGITTANMGEYIQDKSAIYPEDVQDFRVISGHYHARQDIKTGRPRKGAIGSYSYVGNPYTLSYGEANDPEKGFQILMDDGTMEFVPTNLRSHIIFEINIESAKYFDLKQPIDVKEDDLVWVRVIGSREELNKVTRNKVSKALNLESFKLDLIPTDTITNTQNTPGLTQSALLDSLIDSLTNTSKERIDRLKGMWRKLCE